MTSTENSVGMEAEGRNAPKDRALGGVREAVRKEVWEAVLSASVEVPETFEARVAMRKEITDNTVNAILSYLASLGGVEQQGGLGGWQPIETAPRDGTYVLAAWQMADPTLYGVIRWEGGQWLESVDDPVGKMTHWMPLPAAPDTASPAEQEGESFQSRVLPWLIECFGAEIAADRVERCDRFIEEALELAQALDWPKERALALVEYVYGRPAGEPHQEVGGVMVTLAALCEAAALDMQAGGDDELARIMRPEIVLKIRAKQAAKPTGSALPIATTASSVGTEGALAPVVHPNSTGEPQ